MSWFLRGASFAPSISIPARITVTELPVCGDCAIPACANVTKDTAKPIRKLRTIPSLIARLADIRLPRALLFSPGELAPNEARLQDVECRALLECGGPV